VAQKKNTQINELGESIYTTKDTMDMLPFTTQGRDVNMHEVSSFWPVYFDCRSIHNTGCPYSITHRDQVSVDQRSRILVGTLVRRR